MQEKLNMKTILTIYYKSKLFVNVGILYLNFFQINTYSPL